ncbi:hypothetical protein LJC27_04255 [Christensenellaceae bacterium OttesenSCG-928-M15]|nr:hypothetical protein [Christensenellaceae bacterium OttesenSCG-928-M15]
MKYAAVLDIGSSKVVSICAGRVGKDGMAVYGAGVRTYSGFRSGRFVDEQELVRAITESLDEMQKECGFRIREVAISVPAPFSTLILGTGSVSFSEPKRITDADIDMLMNTSIQGEAPEGFSLMHSTPFLYTVDGAVRTDIPDDLPVMEVRAQVSHYYANDAFLDIVYGVLKDVGLNSICVSSMLSEALMLVPSADKLTPWILLDVGYTHTDVCVVKNSAVVAQTTINVGGIHFASDLSYGLEVGLPVAELVKRRYVFGLDYQDSVELLRTPEGTKSVERAYVQYIIEERAKEFCWLIYEAMLDMGIKEEDTPTVYLTGGGVSMMRGSREYLEHMLGMPISKDMPWMPRMNSPVYASAYGALEFVLNTGNEDALTHQVEVKMLKRLRDFFVK